MNTTTPSSERHHSYTIAIASGAAVAVYHIILSVLPGYGFFIDELYYLACAKHLAFGYVDHPPLSIVILAINGALFGDGLLATRVLPALAVGAAVTITGLIARRLGGTTLSVGIACLGAAAMPVFLVMGSFSSMNALEILDVTAILFVMVRMLDEDEPRLWILVGILTGLGLELKHTMGVYAAALVLGVAVTPARKLLWNRWALLGGMCAVLLILPNIVWQAAYGFPSLEFYRNAMVNKNIPKTPVGVIVDQIMFVNPFGLPVVLAGLAFFLVTDRGKQYRSFGWTFLMLLLVMMVGRSSRPDRIGAIYPVIFAGGAVVLGTVSRMATRHIIGGAVLLMLTTSLVLVAPLFTPVLSPARTNALVTSLGLDISIESGKVREPLPQWLGDRLGWPELAVEVQRVFHTLPAEEQHNVVIVTSNYGAAGALEHFGRDLGLPPVYATHNSYHTWGPPADSVRTFIVVMVGRKDLEKLFGSVEEAGVVTNAFATRPQRRIPVYIARQPRFRMSTAWAGFKISS